MEQPALQRAEDHLRAAVGALRNWRDLCAQTNELTGSADAALEGWERLQQIILLTNELVHAIAPPQEESVPNARRLTYMVGSMGELVGNGSSPPLLRITITPEDIIRLQRAALQINQTRDADWQNATTDPQKEMMAIRTLLGKVAMGGMQHQARLLPPLMEQGEVRIHCMGE